MLVWWGFTVVNNINLKRSFCSDDHFALQSHGSYEQTWIQQVLISICWLIPSFRSLCLPFFILHPFTSVFLSTVQTYLLLYVQHWFVNFICYSTKKTIYIIKSYVIFPSLILLNKIFTQHLHHFGHAISY